MPDFSNHALGKREPLNAPALMARDFLTGSTPTVPVAVEHFSRITNWELGRNDEFGTCGPTSVANNLLLTSTYLAQPVKVPDEAIFDLYRRSGNPNFDPAKAWDDPTQDDNGVYLQEMLGALLKDGIGGYKPLAYAKVAPGDMDTLDKCVALFGSVLLGVDLKVPQQRQTVWDYVAGSSEWGGHAVCAGRYNDPTGSQMDRLGIITWAEALDTTRGFVTNQEDEAWVVIWPWHLQDQTFLQGVNVQALASAYQDLTGRPFPAVPAPAPTPTPTPVGPGGRVARPVDLALKAAMDRDRYRPLYVKNAQKAWEAETF